MARPDLSIVPERLNPELTPELEQEVRFFQKWGYLVVDDAITPEQVETLREAMDDADARDTVGWHGEPNPGPYGSLFRELLEEDDRFAFLLDNPPVLTRMGRVGGVVTEPRPSQTRACAIDALGSSPVRFAQVA